ncbi:uncharacterized protein LOC123892221 [Trifolium pratense]|uniref:uncharacterized protein LOC123892221 n=1 Tax=Trifolium pratense TaxID=57577 RepID=UPI001E6949C7|nr:uncharacterized protein LOC123892221 [Trifolium pratense]
MGRRVWNDWFAVHHLKHDDNHIYAPPATDRWEKPHNGWVKCNVDDVFFSEDRVTTMGACFRDHVDNFVAGFTQRQRATLSTVEGEAWALLQAMKKANYRGLDRVQFESNSQVLTEAIRTKRSGNSEFSLVAADIIQIMLLCINFEVKFVRDK